MIRLSAVIIFVVALVASSCRASQPTPGPESIGPDKWDAAASVEPLEGGARRARIGVGIGLGLDQPVAAAFSPPSSSNLQVWADASGTVTSSGGLVTAIADRNGGADLTNAGGTTRPTLVASAYNGLACLRFSGIQYLRRTGPSQANGNATLVAVVKINDTSVTSNFIIGHASNGSNKGWVMRVNDSTVKRSVNLSGFSNRDDGAANTTSLEIWTWIQAGSSGSATGKLRVNGVQDSTFSSMSFGLPDGTIFLELGESYGLGSRKYDLCEGLIWNTNISDANALLTEEYLGTKWGIAGVP